MAHYISYSFFDSHLIWITVVILGLIHAKNRCFQTNIEYLQVSKPTKRFFLKDGGKVSLFSLFSIPFFFMVIHCNCANRIWLHCRRWFIQVSALSTLDGSVLDYHGCNGWRGTRVRFRRGSLRDGYHFQGRQQGRKLTIEQSSSQWRYITMGEEIILS